MTERRQMHEDTSERFCTRWRPALMGFFMRRVGNRSEAEDLTHDALARVLVSGSMEERPDGYIFQVAQNLLIDRARRRKVRDAYVADIKAVQARDRDLIDPAQIAEAREQISMLAAALEELPERTRAIFILYRLENIPQKAIGETFGISTSAVKQQVAKAMAMIVKRMRVSS